jgi:ParB family chromosome partitioning protein
MEEAIIVEAPSTTIEQLAQNVPEVFISCTLIEADFNYRRRYQEGPMQQLRDNIKAVGGLIYPAILRKKDDGRYQLLVGNRRFRAFVDVYGREAEMKSQVLDVTDSQAVALMMSENGAREDPSIIEDAEGAARMLGLCNGHREEASARLGWDRKKFDRRLALMNATDKVRDAYLDDKIGVGQVEILAAFRKEVQNRICDKCAESGQWPSLDGLKKMAEQALCSLEHAIFSRDECNGCQHNTGYQQAMFDNAFEGSRCTNRECYDKKTNAELEVRKDKLSEDYQVVRIVRPGENLTVIALRADGENGVGEEQAKACRACGDFGACVSAVPDKLGKGYRDVCFNKACNEQKVDVERKRKAEADRPAQVAENSPAAGEKLPGAPKGAPGSDARETTEPKVMTSMPTKTSVNSLRNAIKEHREAVWREIFKRAAKRLPVIPSRSLLAAILIHRPSQLDSHNAVSAINEALGENVFGTGNKTQRILAALLKFNQTQLATVFNHLAGHVSKDMPIDDVVGFLKALDIKIEDHWRFNSTFFNVLTKTELDAVCEEVGLAKAAGKTYTSLKNGSKKDFVAAMLKVDGFKYEGAVPKMMRWD